MNENQTILTADRALRVGAFFARHSLALLVTVAVLCILWTISYFALLLWAIVVGGGLGSPASYPAGLIFLLIAGTAVALTLFLPSTALAEQLARRRGLPVLAQIPITVAVFGALCLAAVGIAAAVGTQPSVRGVSTGFGILFVALLVPLGLYWWAAQIGPVLLSLFQWLRSRVQCGFGSIQRDSPYRLPSTL